MRQQEKEGRRNGFSFSVADQDHAGGDAECWEARGLDVDRAARGAYHVRTEWCPDDGGDPGDGDLLYVTFKAFACAGGREPGGVVAASLEVSVLRAWDAEALGSMSGVSSGAGAAAAGGCGALPRVRVYEGNVLRFCPACGCRLLDTPVEILPELTAEERAQHAAGHCEVCPHCRGPVPDVEGLKYCPHCGFEVSTKKNQKALAEKFFYWLFVAILMIGLFVMM